MADSCEHDKESLGSIEVRKYLNQLSDYQLLKNPVRICKKQHSVKQKLMCSGVQIK
jgi:hypothetical protein